MTNFSIVVPTYKRKREITRLLNQLEKLDYKKKYYEVIVVNNDPTRQGMEIVEKFCQFRSNFSFLTEKNPGPSFARNRGIKVAQNDKIIFIDDDCTVKNDLLRKYDSAWEKYPTATIIGGSISPPNKPFNKSENEMLKKFNWCFGILDVKKNKQLILNELVYSANMSVSKKRLTNKFNTKLGRYYGKYFYGAEDYELCSSTILDGGSIFFVNEIEIINCFDNNRMNKKYIVSRYKLAGRETRLMDELLRKKFRQYQESIITRTLQTIKKITHHPFDMFFIICQIIFLTEYIFKRIDQ